jgi:hypothetical protein
VPDNGRARGEGDPHCAAVRHLLAAVQQALSLPAPRQQADRMPYLALLEQRATVAAASVGRLLADLGSGELDYFSEGDHILHQLADLPPSSYRHTPEQP